jgi:capsular exopolysaccharide synthesis family protein
MEVAPFRPDSPAADEGGSESIISVAQLWRAVRKSWWLPLLAVMVCLASAFAYTLGQPRIFEATAAVSFDPNPPRPLGQKVEQIVDTSGDYWNRREYYNTQYWVLTSREVLDEVVQQLGLDRDVGFVSGSLSTERSSKPLLPVNKVASILESRLVVTPVPESRLAKVTYRDNSPERAARILGAVVDTYAAKNQENLMQATEAASIWLRSQVGNLKNELEQSELQLHDFKKSRNILSVSLDDQGNMLREQLAQFNAALTQAEVARARTAARRDELAKVKEDDPSEIPAAELLQSGPLQDLRSEYVSAQRDLAALRGEGKGDQHPLLQAALGRRETTRVALLAEIRNVKGALDKDYAALNGEIGKLNGLVERAKQQGLELNMLEIEFKRLQRLRDTNERLFALVTDRAKEGDLARMYQVNSIRIVDRPEEPERPISPNVPLNLLGGAGAGLLLGLLAAIGRELLDRSIKSPQELEAAVRVPFLGLLPAVAETDEPAANTRRRRRGQKKETEDREQSALAVHTNPTSSVAEAARAIRTNIVFSNPDHPYRVLLVTSAAAAEGKTTVACSIATAMAQAGQRVLLVDCDMRRPRLHQVFGAANGTGLTSALIDHSALDRAILGTAIDNVSLLPTGPLPPNPSELLHSEAFDRVLATLRARYDRIIIDSPPIVPVTDAAILSSKVDGTVLVVRAFKTPRDLAARARRALRDVGAHLVGTVLNGVDHSRGGYGYDRYGYHSYYGERRDDKRATA